MQTLDITFLTAHLVICNSLQYQLLFRFPLLTYHFVTGRSAFKRVRADMSEENNFRMDKQSLSWKLLFRLCNNVSLIRQIELLSFLLTANRPAVYAYWVTKPSIFFPEKQAIHTLAIEPQMRSEKFKLPLPSTIIYTSHRNIWLLLHISSRLRRQPTNTRPRKQSLGLLYEPII